MKGPGYCSSIESGYKVYKDITHAIKRGKAFLMGKLGQTELTTMESWYKTSSNDPVLLMNELFHTAGVFPLTQSEVRRFCEIYFNATKTMDLAVKWGIALKSPSHFDQMLFKRLHTVEKINSLWPWWWQQPYSKHFANRTVLIISPFANYIEAQLIHNRTCIHPLNQVVLPVFSYITMTPPLPPYVPLKDFQNPLAFNSTWTDELHKMQHHMSSLSFDILIVGAGAYGLPLGSHAKQMGKIAIVLGGNLGPLFGLKGGRFDTRPEYQKYFYNSCWVKMDKPPGAERMENSAYW